MFNVKGEMLYGLDIANYFLIYELREGLNFGANYGGYTFNSFWEDYRIYVITIFGIIIFFYFIKSKQLVNKYFYFSYNCFLWKLISLTINLTIFF